MAQIAAILRLYGADCFYREPMRAGLRVVQGMGPPDDSGPRGPKERR
jgi:hypothetical protein